MPNEVTKPWRSEALLTREDSMTRGTFVCLGVLPCGYKQFHYEVIELI